MEDTQKQDKLPPIKYTKRVGHLFEHVRDLDNLKEAIKDAARHKRKRKEVQKVLEDIDGHALELQRMLDEETFIPAKYTMRRINDGIQKKTRDIAIPRFWPDQCVHHAFVRIFKQIVLHSAYPFSCGVDDMVLFDSSKRRLHKALEFIESEVKATKQTVKDNWQVFILSKRPLDFLGFKFHPNKTTIRKSIMLRISRKARTIARAAYASIRNAHAMVSYIGYIVNSDSQRFYEKWVRPFVNIKHLKGVIADEDRKQHQACVAV